MTELANSQTLHVERFRRKVAIGTTFVIVVFGALALAPYVLDTSITQDWVKLFYLISLASMWNLLAGYAGMVSVGQQAFIGLGAYGVFVFNDMGYSAYLSGIIATVIIGVIAFPLSFLAFRLRGGYFAIGTWVIAETVRLIIIRFPSLGSGKGRNIANYTPDPTLRNTYTYWMALGVLIFALGASFTLLRSRLGLALQSIRDNEVAATSLGVNVNRVKRIVYVLAAMGSAGAGAVICVQAIGVASPTQIFGVTYSAFMIFMVLIGGLGTIEGPVIGALIYFFMDKYFSQQGLWYLVALGLVAIIVTLFFPKGIWGEINARWKISLFPVGYQVFAKKK
ncbi:leucine/isoleucine/valine transporter permease subunit [mine drainage metagenome]|uniref:Leucine/isoleucine/valine transporter permease subunit n=1 Tax=mine drainage metagenome TaxID=410659 RepID=A0A1J5Q0W3_9ZZZZ